MDELEANFSEAERRGGKKGRGGRGFLLFFWFALFVWCVSSVFWVECFFFGRVWVERKGGRRKKTILLQIVGEGAANTNITPVYLGTLGMTPNISHPL